MLTLSGRTCVFAGATGNIGRGAVRALARGGMNVVMITHDPVSAEQIMDELKSAPGKVTAYSNEGGDHNVFDRVYEEFGSVDVVINSTGGMSESKDPLEITIDELQNKMSHQVNGPFQMIQAAYPYLIKSRAPRIILTASAGALNGFEGENAADSIARGAVVTMTRVFARSFAEDNITVNCIARSGMIPDHEVRPGDLDPERILKEIPLKKIGNEEDYGALISYLASEEAGFVTGQILNLSGGLVI